MILIVFDARIYTMRRMFICCASFAILVLELVNAAPQAKKNAKAENAAPAYGNADSITEDELKIYLYFLASDQLEGRNLPSRGFDTAALYVASHLAEWGLKPGGSTSGTNGPLQPYFMPMEMVSRQVMPEESKVSIAAPARARRAAADGGGERGAGRRVRRLRISVQQGLDGGGRRAAARRRRTQWT